MVDNGRFDGRFHHAGREQDDRVYHYFGGGIAGGVRFNRLYRY